MTRRFVTMPQDCGNVRSVSRTTSLNSARYKTRISLGCLLDDRTNLYQNNIYTSFCCVLLSQVWNHFDSGSCPGQAIGVRSRLDNGVQGFIPTKFLSDKVVKHPEERVKVSVFFFSTLRACFLSFV